MQEYIEIVGSDLVSSRIALGTWAMGGWMWGGTDEKESIRTIHAALDHGINVIDTAPIYGYGRSEEIVGEAVRQYGPKRECYPCHEGGNRLDDRQNRAQLHPATHSHGIRGFAAPPSNGLHRYLSSPLARSTCSYRGDSRHSSWAFTKRAQFARLVSATIRPNRWSASERSRPFTRFSPRTISSSAR
jgi:hypothetical protein